MCDIVPMKTCPKCGIEKPATTEYWFRSKQSADGFYTWCKGCKNSYNKQYIVYVELEFKYPLSDKACAHCGDVYPATPEYFARNPKTHSGLSSYCYPCRTAMSKEFRSNDSYKATTQARINRHKERNETFNPYESGGIKLCCTCKQEKPVTDFNLDKRRPDGLKAECKSCSAVRAKQWAKDNPEKTKVIQEKFRLKIQGDKRYDYNNPVSVTEKTCANCKCLLSVTEFYTNGQARDGLSSSCKACTLARQKNWKNKNKESIAAYNYNWRKKNKKYFIVYGANRRAKLMELPNTFTEQEWQQALDYFNGCCAVCGRQLNDLFGTHKAAQDHWVPVSYEGDDNPGTVATNIVPLCHGEGGCNNLKNNILPDVWLKHKFGTRKANQILARIETYFAWVLSQNNQEQTA